MVPSTCVLPFLLGSCSNGKGSQYGWVSCFHSPAAAGFFGLHLPWMTGFNVKKAAELLRDLWAYCTEKKDSNTNVGHYQLSSKSWLACLADAAKNYLASDDIS